MLGRPLEIIIEDGKSDVPTITSVAKKLVEEDGVNVMVGLTDTSYMLAAGPVAQEAGIPFLDVGGTAPLITTVGDFIFMLPFGDNVQAAVAAEFAHEQGWKTAALLLDEAMDYTKFLAKYFKDRFTMEDIGGEIVSELSYSMGDTDFSAQLTEFENLDPQPDFLFVSSNPGEIGTIVKQARDLGLDDADRRRRRLRHAAPGRAGRGRGNQCLLHDPPGHLRQTPSRKPSTRPTKPNTATRRKRSSPRSVMTASS